MTRTTVITGGNRGLGFETARQLAARGDLVVIAARDPAAAEKAAAELGGAFVQLDVTHADSIAAAPLDLEDRFGSIDVLVNNAGISMRGFDVEVVRRTLAVNAFGPIAVTDALQPLLADRGIIVNVSSGLGELSILSDERRRDFEDPTLTSTQLTELLDGFLRDVQEGRHRERGWPESAYGVSKVALNAFTRILARELEGTGIRVNAVCPGWVRTDLGGSRAPRSVEEGAKGIVWAATVPADGPTGGFFRDGQQIPW